MQHTKQNSVKEFQYKVKENIVKQKRKTCKDRGRYNVKIYNYRKAKTEKRQNIKNRRIKKMLNQNTKRCKML